MSIKMTSAEIADKQARNLKGSVEDYRRGVERVTESPTVKAASKLDKAAANYAQAISSGKTKRALLAVSADDWKRNTLEKGVSRIAAGIDAAHDKQVKYYDKLIPYMNTLTDKVGKMADLTIEDSIARSSFMIREMSKFSK